MKILIKDRLGVEIHDNFVEIFKASVLNPNRATTLILTKDELNKIIEAVKE